MIEALAKVFFYRISQSNSESERPAVDGSASITRRQRSVVVVGEARELRPKRSIRGVPSLAAPAGAAVFREIRFQAAWRQRAIVVVAAQQWSVASAAKGEGSGRLWYSCDQAHRGGAAGVISGWS